MSYEHDDDLDRVALSALYRQTQTLEPPPAVDARLLAAARRETRHKPRWLMPLALAASVVLAASLVTVMRLEQATYEYAPAAKVLAPQGNAVKAQREVPPAAADAVPAALPPVPAPMLAPAPVLTPAPAPAPAPADAMRSLLPAAPATTLPAAEPVMQAERSSAHPSEQPPEETPEETPAAALAEIVRLRAQGQTQEAEQRLQAFRQRYPTYPLPPELAP